MLNRERKSLVSELGLARITLRRPVRFCRGPIGCVTGDGGKSAMVNWRGSAGEAEPTGEWQGD
jgi:hypothetical protein